MKTQTYLKVENSPIDKEDLINLNVPIHIFKGTEYIKVDPCDYVEDYSKMFIIDIELSEMKDNEDEGVFNGVGNNSKKDFFPIETKLIEVLE